VPAPLTRRTLLGTGGAAALALTAPALAGARRRPRIAQAGERPLITHGVQSGDVSARRAVVWARADRPSRMLVTSRPRSPSGARGGSAGRSSPR